MKRIVTQQKKQDLLNFSKSILKLHQGIQIHTPELMPINYSRETKKFFSSNTYSPQFTYAPQADKPSLNTILNHFWHELLLLHLPEDLESYIESVLYHFMTLNQVHSLIGTEQFAEQSQKLYPFKISKSLLKDSSLLSPPPFADSTGSPSLNANEIKEHVQTYLDSKPYLNDIAVEIDHSHTQTIRASSSQKQRKLIIGAEVQRNGQNVVRLIVHEIESHLLQKQNIYAGSPLLLLRKQYERELFAEGMAIYNEITTGTITKKAYDLYVHRLTAASMIDSSFREIYEHLVQFMPRKKAYLTTFRAKRGMADTRMPGGWRKDAVYLLGYKAINDYLMNGGSIELLYLSQVPELGELLLKHDLLSNTQAVLPEFMQE